MKRTKDDCKRRKSKRLVRARDKCEVVIGEPVGATAARNARTRVWLVCRFAVIDAHLEEPVE